MKPSELKAGDLLWLPNKDAMVSVLSAVVLEHEDVVEVVYRLGPAHPSYPMTFVTRIEAQEDITVWPDAAPKRRFA